MTGLDTNILIRLIVRDDAAQARCAGAALRAIRETGEFAYVDAVVLSETIWVLQSVYRYPKGAIVEVIEKLLANRSIEVEHKSKAWAALGDYRDRACDFTDCLIARINQSAGCTETITFDRQAGSLPGFRLLD